MRRDEIFNFAKRPVVVRFFLISFVFCDTVMSCYVNIFIFELPFPILLWLSYDESRIIFFINTTGTVSM